MANISRITDRLWTGGDLPAHCGPEAVAADLAAIRAAGITHLVDNRLEWSDEELVSDLAPELGYIWNGQDDRGQRMPDTWFDVGVGASLAILARNGTALLAHCHMGVNRGPSMAFAILLGLGWEPVEALTAIRAARPAAAIAYSLDAVDWWGRVSGARHSARRRQIAAVRAWHEENPLDVVRIIRDARALEAAGRPLTA